MMNRHMRGIAAASGGGVIVSAFWMLYLVLINIFEWWIIPLIILWVIVGTISLSYAMGR